MPFLYMRRHQKTVLWAIVIVIVPVFCLWGVLSTRGRRRGGTAGYVMGRRIPRWEFHDAYVRWLRTATLFGQDQRLDEKQMWDRYSIAVTADIWGIQVPEKEIVDRVTNTFRRKGRFDLKNVEDILRQRGLTLDDYEKTTQEMLMQTWLLGSIAGAAKVTDDEARQIYRFEKGTATVSVVRFEAKDFEKDVTADPGDVRHFFARNSAQYRIPEKYRFEYAGVKLKDLEEELEITDKDLQEYYDQNKELYRNPPAAEESDEEKQNKTPRKDEYKPLEEVREDIQSILRKQGVVDVADARLRKIEERIDEISQAPGAQTIDLKELAEEMGLIYGTTDALTSAEIRYHEDLRTHRDRIDYLCGGLDPGELSMGIKGYTSYFVARLLEKHETYVPEFSEAEKEVKIDFIRKQALDKALEAAENFGELVRETSFEQVVEKRELEAENHGPFDRQGAAWTIRGAGPGMVTAIFTTPVGDATEAMPCRQAFAVAKVTARGEPDWNKFKDEKEGLVERYGQAKARAVVGQWLQSIEAVFTPPKSNAER